MGSLRNPGQFFSGRLLWVLLVVCLIAVTLNELVLEPTNVHLEVFSIVDLSLFRHEEHDPYPWGSLEEHTYTPDGLLVVNPNGPHPIFELMRTAEKEWNTKLQRASRTLDEAVAEYKRRYMRDPPLGFDKWWDYVVRNNVQLPDEYDEIYHDLEALYGLDPEDIAYTQMELERARETITVAKTLNNEKLEVVQANLEGDPAASMRRINNILDLVKEIQHELPPLRISFSPHDNPNMLTDWSIKEIALEAARNGTTIKQKDLPAVASPGWIQACPPDSPARRNTPPMPPYPPHLFKPYINASAPKTFIASHRMTMDPCMHPSLLVTHGQYLSHNHGPWPQRTLVPRFSHCGTLLHHDIRPPVPYGWTSGVELEEQGDIPWNDKVDERINWRGSTTGLYASNQTPWSYAHRHRLISLTNVLQGNASVLRVPSNDRSRVGTPEEVQIHTINQAWMDVAFVGGPAGCDTESGACRQMEEMWEFKREQGRREEGMHKFLFDIDGNGWSGRFKRLITSNSLVFKATIYPEWYTSRIAPWLHYVPIQLSYSDLYDAVAFFRAHDEPAARIAQQGKAWSLNFWRREDLCAYFYRLLLEYARISSLDREAMSYRDPPPDFTLSPPIEDDMVNTS